MRSLEKQISIARQMTGNINYGYNKATGAITSGLTQDFFVEHARIAQQMLQETIIAIKADLFLDDEIQSFAADTEGYTLSSRVFGQTKIKAVQYSSDGDVRNYVPLPQRTLTERNTSVSSTPAFYIPKGQELLFNPVPSAAQGSFRATFFKELDDVDIRRGTISGTPSGATIILSATNVYDYDLSEAEYICVSDKLGNSILRGAEISSYNAATHTLTLAANVSTYLVAGYALSDLSGKYVTIGRYSTTHCKLPDICEKYILTYMQKRAYNKEQHEGSMFEDAELQTILNGILATYSEKSEDVTEIPITDTSILF